MSNEQDEKSETPPCLRLGKPLPRKRKEPVVSKEAPKKIALIITVVILALVGSALACLWFQEKKKKEKETREKEKAQWKAAMFQSIAESSLEEMCDSTSVKRIGEITERDKQVGKSTFTVRSVRLKNVDTGKKWTLEIWASYDEVLFGDCVTVAKNLHDRTPHEELVVVAGGHGDEDGNTSHERHYEGGFRIGSDTKEMASLIPKPKHEAQHEHMTVCHFENYSYPSCFRQHPTHGDVKRVLLASCYQARNETAMNALLGIPELRK